MLDQRQTIREPKGQRDRGGQTDGETIMLEINNQSQRDRGTEGDRLTEKQSC